MRDDRLTVVGLFALAVLAWALPPVVRHLKELSRPPRPVIVDPGPAAPLQWSPAKIPSSTPVLTPKSPFGPTPHVGGWKGLLLGQALDLNAATSDDLQALPGIGFKTAAAILSAREQRGGFRAVDDLLEVRGIGPKTLEKLRPLLTAEISRPAERREKVK